MRAYFTCKNCHAHWCKDYAVGFAAAFLSLFLTADPPIERCSCGERVQAGLVEHEE